MFLLWYHYHDELFQLLLFFYLWIIEYETGQTKKHSWGITDHIVILICSQNPCLRCLICTRSEHFLIDTSNGNSDVLWRRLTMENKPGL